MIRFPEFALFINDLLFARTRQRAREILGLSWPATSTVVGSITLTLDARGAAVDASGGTATVTLPPAAAAAGLMFNVKKTDPSPYAVNITPINGELIDGVDFAQITEQWTDLMFTSDGTQWLIL